jgi:hypothetical protein
MDRDWSSDVCSSDLMVMVIGEAVQHWGERKATRPLK